jgi:exopolysaccharide biosynthesis WecB/TagA/CpsF family protein
MSRKCSVLGVNFTSAAKEESVRYIIEHCRELKGEYICFSNVHTTVMAYDDKQYKNVLNTAAFIMPDGKPIAKEMLKNGFIEAERVAGPDFMDEMFRVTAGTDITHYFYGSAEETISKLREALNTNYPGIKIAGMVSPPFRALSEGEDKEAIQAINDSKADLIWIGLGAPKQENWMYNHKGKVNGLMLGVGAGFDFHAGTIKRAPVAIQKIGLEWLYRLLQDPKRLFKRYFVTNTKFIWLTVILKK